jgi:hypothetical protein
MFCVGKKMPSKPCAPGKIRNPATGRCVSIHGELGKKLQMQSEKARQLNMDVVNEIMTYLPPSEKNLSCGQFVSKMEKRYGKLDGVMKELRLSVVKTLEAFKVLLSRTHYIKVSAIRKPGSPIPSTMMDRVRIAIQLAKTATSAQDLVDLCKLIPAWKREASAIVEGFRVFFRRADTFFQTGVRPASFLDNLVVDQKRHSIHHGFDEDDHLFQLFFAEIMTLKRWVQSYKKKFVKDEANLPALLRPIGFL